MLMLFYRCLTTLGAPAIKAYLRSRQRRGKEDAARFDERLGYASVTRPKGKLVWFHAASVGESVSILPIITALRAAKPKVTILVTSGTVTSATLLSNRLPGGVIHQFIPADVPAWVNRFLRHWEPTVAVWVESELWPNLVLQTRATYCPMLLINARISDRSFMKWQRYGQLTRRLLDSFTLILPQSYLDAEKLEHLGARNIGEVGNLKYCSAALPHSPKELKSLQSAIVKKRPAWLAVSTHAGEEDMVAEAHVTLKRKIPSILTLLAPRHPNRGNEIAAALTARGLNVAQRSQGQKITTATDVYLVDTLGELGLFFRMTNITFVGGSLVNIGGHNPLEPARLSNAILFGAYTRNFSEMCAEMLAQGAAMRLTSAAELGPMVQRLIDHPTICNEYGRKALAFAESKNEMLQYVVRTILSHIPKG